MKLFLSDLDNTLLYSYKHRATDDVCIEYDKGTEQGFMTSFIFDLFDRMIDNVCFIPVTTRSVEQYNRIQWPKGLSPEYEVVANGGIMLQNGIIDQEWYNESSYEYCLYKDEIKTLQEKLLSSGNYIRCRIVDDLYLFAYCKDNVDAKQCAKDNSDETQLKVIASGKKLYFFPPNINKGMALTKLRKKLKPELVISAGDSIIDIPMLEKADIAIVPNNYLAKRINGSAKIIVCPENSKFSNYILNTIIHI